MATAYGARSNIYVDTRRLHDALNSLSQGIRVLFPLFQRQSLLISERMVMLVDNYIDLAHRLGKSPDERLLAPVMEIFDKLQKQIEEE